jgi:hypothetical protein
MHKQLHATARSCGMEADCKLQHRTKVNSRRGIPAWVSMRRNVTPYFQSWQRSRESGRGRKGWEPYPVRAPRVHVSGRPGSDAKLMPGENLDWNCRQPAATNLDVQSDCPIVARNRVKARGAKGTTC